MGRRWIPSLLLALALGMMPDPATGLDLGGDAPEGQLAGMVTAHDPGLRSLTLDDRSFDVPPGVEGFVDVEVGDWAIVFYERQGETLVATRIEVKPPE
ncbi:MAG: hypothetical protein ACE5FG_03975 [Myxococcota bacterium]